MYLVISILVLFISFSLFKRASGSMSFNRINMISFIFYYSLFLFFFIGSVISVYNLDNHYLISKIQNQNIRIMGWAGVLYTMIAVPLGMNLINIAMKKWSAKPWLKRYLNSSLVSYLSIKDSYIRYPLYGLTLLSIIASLYTFFNLTVIPIFSLFEGASSLDLAMQRITANYEFSGNIYVKNIFALLITPILSYIAFAYWRMTGYVKDLIWFLLLFFISILLTTYNLSKAPLLWYFIGFIMLYVIINGKIRILNIAIAGIILIFFTIIMYTFIAEVTDLNTFISYNSGPVGRTFLGQISGLFHVLNIFPEHHDFLGFSSFSRVLSNVFDLEHSVRSARIVMEHINPIGVQEGIAGVDCTLFIGEAWANFGWIGFIFSPFYVGIVIQSVYILFLNLKKTPLFVGLFAYLSFAFANAIIGGFNDFLYNAGYIVIFITYIFVFAFAKIIKHSKTKMTE